MLDVVNHINPNGLPPYTPAVKTTTVNAETSRGNDNDHSLDTALSLPQASLTIPASNPSIPPHDSTIEIPISTQTSLADAGALLQPQLGLDAQSVNNLNADDATNHDNEMVGEDMDDEEDHGLLADDLDHEEDGDSPLGPDIDGGLDMAGEDYGDEGDPAFEDQERNSSAE